MTPPFASLEDIIFDVSTALRVPVLIAALAALALVLWELGALWSSWRAGAGATRRRSSGRRSPPARRSRTGNAGERR